MFLLEFRGEINRQETTVIIHESWYYPTARTPWS